MWTKWPSRVLIVGLMLVVTAAAVSAQVRTRPTRSHARGPVFHQPHDYFPARVTLLDTTNSIRGVIYKGSTRFLHNFHHPTGSGGFIPVGQNLFLGEQAGNFTAGSVGMQGTYEASDNVGIGFRTMPDLTTGWLNVAVGSNALVHVTDGTGNVAVGYGALFWVTGGDAGAGDSNVGIGGEALSNITTGQRNVALGGSAGRFLATYGGSQNQTTTSSIYIGSSAAASADGVTNEIVIGDNAIGSGSNTVTLGNPAVTTWNFGSPTNGSGGGLPATTGVLSHQRSTVPVTCNSGTGTCTATGLIPAGAKILSVTARVTTILAGAGLTTWSLGVAGQTDLWATGRPLAAGTIVDSSHHRANWTNGGLDFFASATNVILTAAAGVFSSGVVKITVLYSVSVAPAA